MHHGKISKSIAKGLKELRKRIEKHDIPPSKLDETLLLATWNIRAFGSKNRKKASLHYIAEILGQFDLIAVTEVGSNIRPLAHVLEILGPYWRVVFSDFESKGGGNNERIAFVFDKRAVSFTGLAAEADPPDKIKNKDGEWVPERSWWRSPYMASFRAGNFDFVLVAAHTRWGKKAADRLAPLKLLAKWVRKRRDSPNGVDKDIIVLGDLNIPKRGDKYAKAIQSEGLRLPRKLAGDKQGSNLSGKNTYDQILHYPTDAKRFTDHAGVLNFLKGGIAKLYPGQKMTKRAFTFQMSDHFPLWVEIDTYIDGARLDQIINGGKRLGRRSNLHSGR